MRTKILALMVLALGGVARSEEPTSSEPPPECTVQLQYGKDIALSDHDAQRLREVAMEMLESANFNSNGGRGSEIWGGVAGVQKDYRKAVAGNYLLVSFKKAQQVKTLGGRMTVVEVLVGFTDQGWPSLFSIDDSNRITAYTKYGGADAIECVKVVKRIANGAN